MAPIAEELRLVESRSRTAHWKRRGPYLAERASGTVREDCSASGAAREHLTHEKARSRAYRWNEDGIAGMSDRHEVLCFALSVWNGKDLILQKRRYGLAWSLGSALAAREPGAIWICAIAPPLGMVAAASLLRRQTAGACAKLFHSKKVSCIYCGRGMAQAEARRAA